MTEGGRQVLARASGFARAAPLLQQRAHKSIERARSLELALPNHVHRPAGGLEEISHTAISRLVGFELRRPELRTGLRLAVLAVVRVPEAAVDEDDGLDAAEYDVRRAGELTVVQTVAEAGGVDCLSDNQLRLGVLAADGGHNAAADGGDAGHDLDVCLRDKLQPPTPLTK